MSARLRSSVSLFAVLLAAALPAQAGAPDTSFGGGFVANHVAPPNQYDFGWCVAVQADGKVVVAGWTRQEASVGNPQWAIARYCTDGTLDPGFGQGGVTRLFGQTGSAQVCSLVIDGSGRLVVAGWGNGGWTIARLTSAGQLDGSFGNGGVVQTVIASNVSSLLAGLIVQPDGKLVAAGKHSPNSGSSIALVRYHANGSLDTSFGKKGIATFIPGRNANFDLWRGAIARQADGKILLGGLLWDAVYSAWSVFRVTAAGALDSSFGTGGVARVANVAGSSPRLHGIAVQSDGRIVTSGHVQLATDVHDIAVARFLATGAPDPTFGTGGLALSGVGVSSPFVSALGRGCAVQSDGRIVVGGAVRSGSGAWAMTACRLLANGTPDAGFGASGIALPWFVAGANAIANNVAIDPTGGEVVGFGIVETPTLVTQFAVAKWLGQ